MKIRHNESGFTLVELLIVVIILGILAAVVIPQFNNAAAESKEAALSSNLATVRQSIELYKVQHNDAYPGTTMVVQLTGGTDVAGAVGTKYGPYIRNTFPANPINSKATVTTAAATPAAGTDVSGWFYNTVTGEFRADSPGSGPSGKVYFTL